MITTKTPETDAEEARIGACGINGDFARKLERERDEARKYAERCKQGCIKLSFAIDRIDYACGEPNEMEVSDYCIHQNEEHVVKRVKEKFKAMREAIKGAQIELAYAVQLNAASVIKNNISAALAKLQPFIKP